MKRKMERETYPRRRHLCGTKTQWSSPALSPRFAPPLCCAMTLDPLHALHPTREARQLFAYLHHRSGTVRLKPLLRGLAMDRRTLVDAIADLSERYWITVVWRKPAPGTP